MFGRVESRIQEKARLCKMKFVTMVHPFADRSFLYNRKIDKVPKNADEQGNDERGERNLRQSPSIIVTEDRRQVRLRGAIVGVNPPRPCDRQKDGGSRKKHSEQARTEQTTNCEGRSNEKACGCDQKSAGSCVHEQYMVDQQRYVHPNASHRRSNGKPEQNSGCLEPLHHDPGREDSQSKYQSSDQPLFQGYNDPVWIKKGG